MLFDHNTVLYPLKISNQHNKNHLSKYWFEKNHLFLYSLKKIKSNQYNKNNKSHSFLCSRYWFDKIKSINFDFVFLKIKKIKTIIQLELVIFINLNQLRLTPCILRITNTADQTITEQWQIITLVIYRNYYIKHSVKFSKKSIGILNSSSSIFWYKITKTM